jgi:hypothetical protein
MTFASLFYEMLRLGHNELVSGRRQSNETEYQWFECNPTKRSTGINFYLIFGRGVE